MQRVESGRREACERLSEQRAEVGEGNVRALIKHQRLLLPPPFHNVYMVYIYTKT
jgi:hypothetical protein